MELTHRETDEHLDIASDGNEWTISGPDPAAARLAFFMLKRCNAENVGPYLEDQLRSWNHNEAAARATRVAAEFQNELLMPFANGHMFWGSWKWIGWFGTEFTWVGRWIMDSVVRNDARAVNLCIYWLRNGTCHESQSKTLRYALERFTGQSYATDAEWLQWYDFQADPGGVLDSEPHQHGAVECLSVLEGELEVEVGGVIDVARAGDTLRYRADKPHTIRNCSDRPAHATMVCILKAAVME
jgi:mannose-6-phosphate isomerase-like protein (cupin superfamily)